MEATEKTRPIMKSFIKVQEYLSLSALINYQLSADPINWRAVISLMLGDRLQPVMMDVLLEVLVYLGQAYGGTKRKLGTRAILHPIRTAYLLGLVLEKPVLLDLATALLHDKNEDLTEDKYTRTTWQCLEKSYGDILRTIHPADARKLNEQIDVLARKKDEMYYQYIGRVLECATSSPQLIHAKLADRLDNSMDLRMDIQDETSELDCYRIIFDVLYVNVFKGPQVRNPHPVARRINGAKRLYQLFKNAILLSLLRKRSMDRIDEPTHRLFDALARASIHESQQIVTHIFSYHMTSPQEQREVLTNAMRYCQAGHIAYVSEYSDNQLDGLFKYRFDHKDKKRLDEKLDDLYKNKRIMAEAAIAFVATFSSFLSDPDFRIQGIEFFGIYSDPTIVDSRRRL